MANFRRVTLAIVFVAALSVLALFVYLLWSARQWDYLPMPGASASDLNAHLELLRRRIGDLEILVLALLGLSGLYAIVFVVAAHLGAASFSRQADRSIADIKDQLALAMGNLRELKEGARETSQLEGNLAALHTRVGMLNGKPLGEEQKLELAQCEYALAALDALAGGQADAARACVHRAVGGLYAAGDSTRARYHLQRALELTPAGDAAAMEIHYDLACLFAGLGDAGRFQQAVEQLQAALRRPSKHLEDRLARDIGEGGALYQLANTPPFDKAINDLLLNVSIAG
jgi:tetratricopeptide (TPR) repeat protein